MSSRDHKIFIRSIFEPLTDAAGRPDLLDKLTTEPVPDDRKDEQFKRFRSFNIDHSDVVYLPNGGFAALYEHSGGRYLGISSAGLIAHDEAGILQWATERGLDQEDFDESTFLCFAHFLKGYYRLADRFRSSDESLNIIEIVNEDYKSHSFRDLFSYYKPVIILRISEDSPYYSRDIFSFASELCCKIESLRSAIIDHKLASTLLRLVDCPNIPNDNLFQAATSSHFRHTFLELYRCVESIFYLPWIIDLKSSSGIHIRACELKNTCRSTLNWREKELPSMEKIFTMFPPNEDLDALEDEIDLFKDLKNGKEFARTQLGKRIYAIRNGMVHHENYEESSQYKPNDVQWRHLSLYIAYILLAITDTYARDLTPHQASPGAS